MSGLKMMGIGQPMPQILAQQLSNATRMQMHRQQMTRPLLPRLSVSGGMSQQQVNYVNPGFILINLFLFS